MSLKFIVLAINLCDHAHMKNQHEELDYLSRDGWEIKGVDSAGGWRHVYLQKPMEGRM